MASQVGQLGGLPAHSGADTALSGADAFSQDDGVAVESPLVTDSQASVALAGEHSLPHAAGSTAHTSAPLIANGSALSVTDTKGRQKKAQGAQTPAHSSSLDGPAHSSRFHAAPLQNSQQAVLPYPQQEPGTSTHAVAALSEPPGQLPKSPFPHCNLASFQRRPSAAMSVEAVRQGGDDDEVQGDFTSNQAGGGATSLPASSSAKRPRPTSLYGILPVAPASRQRSPAAYKAASRSGIEIAHSVVYDSEYQHNPQSSASQQLSGMSPTQRSHKRHRAEAGENMPAPHPAAAQCSGASQIRPNQHDICQAAPDTTQQAAIEEALSGQQYDEEAQQSAHNSTESHGQTGMSPGMSLGNAAGAANSLGSQPSSHVAAEAVAAAQHFVNAEPCPADASPDAQQTTASNDGLVAVGSHDTQQDAAAASVHATALGEDLPASDADTDLSSVGLQPGRRQLAQSSIPYRHRPRLPHSADSSMPDVPAHSDSKTPRSHFGNSQATSQRQM